MICYLDLFDIEITWGTTEDGFLFRQVLDGHVESKSSLVFLPIGCNKNIICNNAMIWNKLDNCLLVMIVSMVH